MGGGEAKGRGKATWDEEGWRLVPVGMGGWAGLV